MRFGVRGLLLLVAIILFLLSIVVEANRLDLLSLGLAFLAGALLVDELNLGVRGGPRARL
ncbi:MAG: hypothetical protein M3198_20325 [Actinomycetota bacterium]|nr:hypothetical protein [Actinomycetota bacterium]